MIVRSGPWRGACGLLWGWLCGRGEGLGGGLDGVLLCDCIVGSRWLWLIYLDGIACIALELASCAVSCMYRVLC